MKAKHVAPLCLCSLAAAAADYVWTGAAGADFANPANWLVAGEIPATPPASDDTAAGDVVILPEAPTANQPALSADWNLKELRYAGANWTFSTSDFKLKVGRFGNGVATANASGTNTFSGNLRLGSVDTPGPGWDIAAGGLLRIDGTVGRYAQTSGGGTILKRGGGTLELNTGTSTLNSLTVEGGTVRVIAGVGALDANKSLTVTAGTYDLNGNNVSVMSLGGTASGTVTNSAETYATLSTSFGGSSTLALLLAGPLHFTWGHNGTPRNLTFNNAGNTYTGRTTVNSGITAILRADAPFDAPGVFGASQETVTLGTPTSAGGGTAGRVAAVLTDGPYVMARPVVVGTDKGRHVLGTTAGQTGPSTFSGPVLVGLGALYNGDNPHLEIQVGADAQADFDGPITNALGKTGNYALRDGKVIMLGPGLARLAGDNAYKGGTIISNGTLLACSAAALGTGGAEVAGGTLGGTATVAGVVSVLPGATLTAGATNSIGTLTLHGGLTLAAGSALTFQLAGDQADTVRVTGGDLAVTGPVTVNAETLEKPEPGLYPVLDWSGAASGAPQVADFALNPPSAGYSLVLAGSTLFVRVAGAQGTLISVL